MARHPLPVAVALVMILAGCAASDTAVTDPGSADPTTSSSSTASRPSAAASSAAAPSPLERDDAAFNGSVQLPATGVLGVEDIEGGCVFVEVDGRRYELIASPDADLAIDPGNVVVADSQGTVIARAGDTITVDGQIDPGVVTFCQIGPVLVATDIQAD
ncbi:MAG: hypothetical protein ACR2HR_18565 [Euzebya sp.]